MPQAHGSPAEVSKGEFAALLKRSPQAVSGWIKDGKIHGPALVGDGHRAKINVEAALAQLGLSLDLSQQLSQPEPILALEAPAAPAQAAPLAPVDDDQRKLLRARREREELDLSIAQAKAREFEGHWIETTAAAEAWGRELAGIFRSIETWLLTGAPATVAALESREPRAIAAALKQGFRELRQRIAEQAALPRPEPTAREEEDEEDSDAEV